MFSAPLHRVAVIRIYFDIYLNHLSPEWFLTEQKPTLSDDRVPLSTLLSLHFGFCSPVVLSLYFYCFLLVREANQRLYSFELIGHLNLVVWITDHMKHHQSCSQYWPLLWATNIFIYFRQLARKTLTLTGGFDPVFSLVNVLSGSRSLTFSCFFTQFQSSYLSRMTLGAVPF